MVKGKDLWVGIDDRAEEGVYRFTTDNTYFDSSESLFKWDSGEPNNQNNEDCVHLKSSQLNDVNCNDGYYYHGLCEYKVFDC